MSVPELPESKRKARFFLIIAITVVGIEAAVYLVLAILSLIDLADAATGVGIALFLALYGIAQLYAGWRLLTWHAWARGPLMLTQLVQVGLAWGLRDSDRLWLAVLMAISAAIALGCLVAPVVTRALLDEDTV